MPAPQPRMHGLTHVPGGSDPIPGLTLGGGSFMDTVLAIAATKTLSGYWRLGDGATPWLDTSGYSSTDPAPLTRAAGGAAMTQNYTPGALPPDDDDGAVAFNAQNALADRLQGTPATETGRFNAPNTVACWVKPFASTSTWVGGIVNAWSVTDGKGWGLMCSWPTRTLQFRRGATSPVTVTGPVLAADTWSFIAATYSTTNGHRLYVNGALVASDPATSSPPPYNLGVFVGSAGNPSDNWNFFGAIDETTIWNSELAAAEISTLYNSVPAVPVTPADLSAKVDRDAVEAATARLVAVKLAAGDTQPAFKIQGDGRHDWGAGGSTAPDTNLYRPPGAPNTLKTDGNIWVGGTAVSFLNDTGRMYFGTTSDTSLYRGGAGRLQTDGSMWWSPTSSGYVLFVSLAADSQPRWRMFTNGTQEWGPGGSTAPDTWLYRGAAGKLGASFAGVGDRTIEVGAADSGGSGFRMLRIAN